MQGEGRTILFVTHDMGSVERFCDRAMLLERGRVARPSASPRRSRGTYREVNFGRRPAGDDRGRTARSEVASAALVRGPGRRADRDRRAGRARRRCAWRSSSSSSCATPLFAHHLPQRGAPHDLRAATELHRRADRRLRGRASAVDRALRFENWLAPSRYTLTPASAGGWRLRHPRRARSPRDDLAALVVKAPRSPAAWSTCRTDVEIERCDERGRAPRRATAVPRRSATTCAASASLTWMLAVDRLQAALLRLGARLRLDADAAAAAVRRALLRVHRGGAFGGEHRALPRLPALRDRAVHLLRARPRAAA